MAQLSGCSTAEYHHHNQHHSFNQYIPYTYEDYENERLDPYSAASTAQLDFGAERRNMLVAASTPMMMSGPPMSERNHRRTVHEPVISAACLGGASSTGAPVTGQTASAGRASAKGGSNTKRTSPRNSNGVKPVYKHVPHRDKPPHMVEKRNARERRRVQAVNTAFQRLRKCVPVENRNKRISKVKTLQKAIEYISHLEQILAEDLDDVVDVRMERHHQQQQQNHQPSIIINKENTSENLRWSNSLEASCKQHNAYMTSYNNNYLH